MKGFYQQLKELASPAPTKDELIVQGDLNAKVGQDAGADWGGTWVTGTPKVGQDARTDGGGAWVTGTPRLLGRVGWYLGDRNAKLGQDARTDWGGTWVTGTPRLDRILWQTGLVHGCLEHQGWTGCSGRKGLCMGAWNTKVASDARAERGGTWVTGTPRLDRMLGQMDGTWVTGTSRLDRMLAQTGVVHG